MCFAPGRMVSGDCQGEMLDYRRMLMEDFSLSPEIVLHCRGEIENHCSGLHRKGRTLHCLMRVGRGDKGPVDSLCQNAVSTRVSASDQTRKHDCHNCANFLHSSPFMRAKQLSGYKRCSRQLVVFEMPYWNWIKQIQTDRFVNLYKTTGNDAWRTDCSVNFRDSAQVLKS